MTSNVITRSSALLKERQPEVSTAELETPNLPCLPLFGEGDGEHESAALSMSSTSSHPKEKTSDRKDEVVTVLVESHGFNTEFVNMFATSDGNEDTDRDEVKGRPSRGHALFRGRSGGRHRYSILIIYCSFVGLVCFFSL